MRHRTKPAGVWRGAYFFDDPRQQIGREHGVPFELRLTQTWWQRFTLRFAGSVTDDEALGMPGVGAISGAREGARIGFVKRMPEFYSVQDGALVAVRQILAEQGIEAPGELRHPPIYYEGAFESADAASGTWHIRPCSLQIGPTPWSLPGCTGKWTLHR